LKKSNKTDLLIEEYDSHFLYETKKTNLNISFNRIAFIFFVFVIVSLIFSVKATFLGSLKKKISNRNLIESEFRSSIVDRNGNIIAKTIISNNVGINPNLVIEKRKLLINLRIIFPEKKNVEFNKIKENLNGKKFFYIKKKISQSQLDELILLGDKSIIVEKKISRIYTHENLFSHLIGQIDDSNNGISGIEKSFDKELKKNSLPLRLTVDTDIQYLIREELKKSVEIFQNLGSAAILMDINSGDIISLVSLPDFNLNKRESIKDLKYTNKITKGVYELGSVFKTLTLAAAFQNNIIEPETKFEKIEKKIFCDKYTIAEYDKKLPSELTAEQILVRSSNIGSVRIAQKIGIEEYSSFLKKIGVLGSIDFDIEEIGQPLNFRWGKCKLATVSFGHGIATTPLQLAKAYGIISNGGYQINPTLIYRTGNLNEKKQILNSEVSKKINPILRKVVSTKEGTAHFADVYGYEVAGKTGTADKVKNGVYTKDKINTFVSVFPISNPKFLLLVLLDEPKPSKEYVYNYRDGRLPYKGNRRNTAGWTTVLIAGNIIENIGPILATKY
jgi:cell division protein FtsI (penicillin-binding protein 3)|tara:strand:- start:1713 stop:3389 length:1677 start_codon:yes stop_codon:yes gene_type:complete